MKCKCGTKLIGKFKLKKQCSTCFNTTPTTHIPKSSLIPNLTPKTKTDKWHEKVEVLNIPQGQRPIDASPELAEAYEKLGVPIRYIASGTNYPLWDGETFSFRVKSDIVAVEAHELMHWLITDDETKKRVEFGLGPSADPDPLGADELTPEEEIIDRQAWEKETAPPQVGGAWEGLACDMFPVIQLLGISDSKTIFMTADDFGSFTKPLHCKTAIDKAWKGKLELLTDKTKEEYLEDVKNVWSEWCGDANPNFSNQDPVKEALSK